MVELVGTPPTGSGSKKVKFRIVEDVTPAGESQKGQQVEIRLHISGNRRLADRPGAKRYVALLRSYTSGKTKRWNLTYLNPTSTSPRQYYYLLALDNYGDGLWKVVRDLIPQANAKGGSDSAGRFDRMLAYIAGDDPQARDFAACYAGAYGWGFTGDTKAAAQPDAFARALLAATEPKVRGWMAKAYTASKADLLPREPLLLQRLLDHADKGVYTPVLKDGLRRATGRADALTEVIRPRLDGSSCDPRRRSQILHALTGWKEHAVPFVPQLEAIARGKATPPATDLDRVMAVRLCLDLECDHADRLVLDTLTAVPSSVALKYAVDHKLLPVVPAVIRAARAGRLQWTETHGAALALLTRRFAEGSFEAFDAWWASVEKSGRTEQAMADGFADRAAGIRARKLIAQLGSDRYKVREAARAELTKLGPVVLDDLEAARKSANPEVAASAARAAAEAKARFEACINRLSVAATAERAGRSFLPIADLLDAEDDPDESDDVDGVN